jgi:hypothetical protein
VTAARLLQKLKKAGEVSLVFRFPYAHLMFVSDEFEALDDDEREELLASKLGVSVGELRQCVRNNLMSIHLITAAESSRQREEGYRERGYHWLTAFAEDELDGDQVKRTSELPFKVIHFYGYKGGQARSTLLAILARELAEDGWRVLALDCDLEAPSLDVVFSRASRSLASTVLGLVQGGGAVTPERIVGTGKSGYVDLLACRPQSAEFDIDSAAFALKAVLDPGDIDLAAKRVVELWSAVRYDVVLIDHRSGLSHATLPWMAALPGPVVVCVRLDEQWRPASHSIRAVLRMHPSDPGLFVSWKPDEENPDSYRRRNYPQVTALLEMLSEATSAGGDSAAAGDGQLELGFAELEDHWIVWPYDPAFRQARMPERVALSGLTMEALADIRSLLDLSEHRSSKEVSAAATLSPSGSIDPGDLIQTDAIRQLKNPGNSISYILGRKGTGKTRLVRELAEASLGEPLIVDPNTTLSLGIKSASPELVQAASLFGDQPMALWWHLLSAALENPRTSARELTAAFSSEIRTTIPTDPVKLVLDKCRRWPKRVFLLDGLETAFTANKIFQFLESLFLFLQIVESDSRLSERIQIKLFLRTDLAQHGYQNIEQQLHGRTIYLSWDTQKIFNFVLSRIVRLEWFKEAFPSLVTDIWNRYAHVLEGNLSVTDCESLLMNAFPSRLSRNNLATKTFLKTYFADTARDRPGASTSDTLRYYPRIFDKFLEVISDPKRADNASFHAPRLDKDNRINQALIFFAHEAAAADYLEQLRSELNYLINFSADPNENAEKVKALLTAFDGLKTPFTLDEHVDALARRTNIDRNEIRKAMQSMRSMGLFEDRPGSEEWRVGRLFKSALRMKYVRA